MSGKQVPKLGNGVITTAPASGAPSTDVNLAEVAGTTTAAGAGAVDGGTQRTTLASDDPAVSLLGTIDADTSDIKTAVESLANKPAVTVATGSGAIATSTVLGVAAKVDHISLKLDAAGTTSEDFTVTLNAQAGADYDTLSYTLDLSIDSVTNLIIPAETLGIKELFAGDEFDVAWPNTEGRTYGLRIVTREI
jgi:hypothetical protein